MSEDVDALFSYIFTWHAFSDACRKCRYLDGKEWTDQDLFQEVLWDPIWGDIWDLTASHSLAHGKQAYNCRCQLTVRVEVDWDKWRELNELRNSLSSNIREAREEVKDLKMEIVAAGYEMRQFSLVTSQGLSMVRRLTGGSEAIDDATAKMSLFINTMNMARHTYQLFLASTGPWGWAMLGISAVSTVLSVADLAMEFE